MNWLYNVWNEIPIIIKIIWLILLGIVFGVVIKLIFEK